MPRRPEILFLIGDIDKARNDNHVRLPDAFRALGWQVSVAAHESVRVSANSIELQDGDPGRYDLIWLLGFGRAATFFDRMQLLRQLPQSRFVTTVDALMYLHGKHRWLQHMPETHTSADLQHLLGVIKQGGEWIIKPPAGSYGRDVRLVRNESEARAALSEYARETDDGYCMIQRFLPQIADGEKRTIIAAGRIIGSYLKVPSDELLANVNAQAAVAATSLTAAESKLVGAIAGDLTKLGAGFAAIDTVYPYLIEVNVANPGGLAALSQLADRDCAAATAEAVIDGLRDPEAAEC